MIRGIVDLMTDKGNGRTPFWKSVNRGRDDECWDWKGDIDIVSGFGVSTKLVSGGEVTRYAHRIAFILTYGVVPAGHVIRHFCRNKLCCNPEHLTYMRKHPDEEDEHFVTMYYYSSRRAKHLSEFERRRITSLRAEGVRLKDLSLRFGVSQSTISRTVKADD